MTDLLRIPMGLFILLYQSFMLALMQVWSNKLRSLLTTLGIVIGVASVCTIIAALSGLKQNVLSEFETFGTNKIFISASRPLTGALRMMPVQRVFLKPREFEGMLEQCPSLKAFSRIHGQTQAIGYQQKTVETVQTTGIEPAWHEIEHRPIIQGRPFSYLDNELSRRVCIINPKLRDELALPTECIGEVIRVGQTRYMVIGILEPRITSGMFGGGGSDSEVYVPFNTLYRQTAGTRGFAYMMVVAASRRPELSEEAKGEISFLLRQRRKIPAGEPDTFTVQYVSQFVEQFDRLASTITIVAAGIVSISLVVGGVGIMNIMLVSVSERTREIGLRKAVGARPGAVMLQFLVEAVFLCLLGGLLGLMIAQVLTVVLQNIPGAQLGKAYIPGWAVALSFGFSAMVGLIFGMFPAIKAARLDPIEALRHE